MVMIPELKTTLNAVDSLEFGGEPRTYLGMSGIGEECLRKLWNDFHWTQIKKHSAKAERIFSAGHLFEAQIISQLKKAGMEVFRVDENGKEIELFGLPDEEQETFIGFANHALGHCDGRIRGVIEAPKTVHILEIKTMAQKYFTPLVKKGVQENNPNYYAQMQRYMLASKLNRALFIAVNKNTSELHIERINLDKSFAETLEDKERDIILTEEVPDKIFAKGFWKCNFCTHNDYCHEDEEPELNCRTCEYSDINMGGVWSCSLRDDKPLAVPLQRKGCSKYKKGWGL